MSLIDEIAAQQEKLVFPRFSIDDAFNLGVHLREAALKEYPHTPVSIRITLPTGQILFSTVTCGPAAADAESWLARKAAAVLRYGCATLYLGEKIRAKGLPGDRIEHLGRVSSIVVDAGGCTLTIAEAAPILGDCHVGDSIAVNGACLTVTEFDADKEGGWFKVWLANETLERTDLGERKEGDQLNLERAMGTHVRFGGHFVQAHVDTTATVVSRTPDGDSLRVRFELPEATPARPSLLPYLIPKGYVTIDGASLTLTAVDDETRTFEVMLIQHTQEKITLAKKAVGSKVNIEVDMVGKYVQKSVVAALGGQGGEGLRELVKKVVREVLSEIEWRMAEHILKRKILALTSSQVTVKLTYTEPSPARPARANLSRPASPIKLQPTPPVKPRAKVNVSAQITRSRSPVRSSPIERPPRPTSPAKPPPPRTKPSTLSPTFHPKPKLKPSVRNLNTPDAPRAAEPRFSPDQLRGRNGSVSLHHSVSFSSLQASHSDSDGRYSPSPSVRVRSKVSGLAKPPSESLSPPAARPPAARTRNRAPSLTSSVVSSPPAPTFYPITTATPAANPHRYQPPTPARCPPFHPFRARDPSPSVVSRRREPSPNPPRRARVDPAAIPLPANSPPTSALSFSSRSSVSVDNPSARLTPDDSMRSTLDSLLRYTELNSTREDSFSGDSTQDPDTDGEAAIAARKVKAEAKSNRKIADLEITNRSLLAINASLESAKHKQAKEIRELRRKLRESRLILPPRAFRAVNNASPSHDNDADADADASSSDDEDNDNGNAPQDEVYRRIKAILESLLDSGRRALERQPHDFPEVGKGGAKVLSADEVRSWRDSGGLSGGTTPKSDDLDANPFAPPLSPAHIAAPESDSDDALFGSEDEVEMTLTSASRSMPPSPGPPILITDSH
ncbi:hypothetical protein H0H81_000283 [Sphagnurus paluster]|uniref:Riboflavin synthase n=1 Tax=Sphagnurus paluster TaxID=117069 RepID=A0A9P7FTN9_9AGAR|nr:hypothetical protein H0H81_000283 [Sphagnurus paluster]